MPLSSEYWDGISQGGFYDPYASGKGLRKELQRKGGGQSDSGRHASTIFSNFFGLKYSKC